ncbi:protein tyrosine phosphatase family protein [Colwelliaceae bacterium BS250]
MKYTSLLFVLASIFTTSVHAMADTVSPDLADLKNYQVNNSKMISSGLPNQQQFDVLKTMGVTQVIDLIPGDRTEESALMTVMSLSYHNIPVDWENPTIDNFNEYVVLMQQFNSNEGKTLTHCRLNWRGAVFTYLYRVTQLHEPEELAKQDMLDIWLPNETWQDFIDQVKAQH